MNRGTISNILRTFGLLCFFDRLHFQWQKIRFHKANKLFRNEYPEVKLPPDYLMYESFQLNYKNYYLYSDGSAKNLASLFDRYKRLENLKILDWGCGPARILRHLAKYTGEGCEFFGADYNAETIRWCRENIPGIKFDKNPVGAQLPYDNNYFDFIYGFSVFTHLSHEKHFEWIDELSRVLKPGGILILSTQGQNYFVKLTKDEKKIFQNGGLVVRGKSREGHRTYSAFHPEKFMHTLFEKMEILEHIQPKPESGKAIPQDVWIVKKIS